MHPGPLQAKHQNVLSKQMTSDRDVAKTSAFKWIKAAAKAIKRVEKKTKQKLSFEVGFYAQRRGEIGRPWLAELDYGWQVLVWKWLWTSCPIPGPWVLLQARTYARGRAGIFTSCSTWAFSSATPFCLPSFFCAYHLLFIILIFVALFSSYFAHHFVVYSFVRLVPTSSDSQVSQ